MSSRDSLENSKEDKHLKFADGPRKTIEEMKEDNLQKLDSPGRSEKQRKSGELKLGKLGSGKASKKVEEMKTKPMTVTRQVKNLKSNKRNFTNAFKPVVMRDAETMTDLLRIFESPSKSVVSVFKSTPFHLQEIEVMTDLTGEEVAEEVGLKDMETTTEDLAINVLEMTNDLDYMNLKLLEDEKERKMEGKSVVGGGGELNQNIPEESDGVYGNLMERMYICLGITPVETIKRGEVGKQVQDNRKVSEVKLEEVKEEEVVGGKLEKQESLRSADTMFSTLDDEDSSADNLSQLRSSSMRSTMRDSVSASDNIEEEVNYEGDGNEEEKSVMGITEEKSVMAITEEKSVMGIIEEQQEPLSIEDGVVEDEEEVVIKEEEVVEEEMDIDEIQEGLMYSELNEAYHFRELFDVDESEVYVEENIHFGSEEDIYREDVRGSNEGWFHIKGGEEREAEESATEILVRRATMTEDTATGVEDDSGMDLYRSTLLAEVVVDEEYQNITEKLFTEEEIEEFQDDVEVYEDTVEIDKYVGVYIDDHMDFYTEIELNYPRYDDEWDIPKVIETLCEDQTIGKVLNDFGLLEDLEEENLQIRFRPTFESDTIGRLDSSTVSFLEEATKYAEQITHLSELDAATAKVSSQFRVSMIYNEEPGSHIDEKEIQSLLKKEESLPSANMESWLRRQSLRTEILDVDQSPYIVRSEIEYDRDLDLHTREFENSVVDDLKFGVRSSEEIEKKEVEDDSSSEMTASLGSSAGSNMEILSNNEFYPRILDETKNASAHSSTLSLLKKFQTGGRKPNKDESVSMILYNEGDKDYEDDDDDDDDEDDISISQSNQDSVDVILGLIKSDPYGSYITHKMLNMLEYFKKFEFQNEVPHKLKALEALLVKKAARKKFTETLQLKSAKHSESNIDNYSCKPEIFNDSVSVLVWNIFNCFFLPISSKISHRMGSSQTSKGRKQVIPKLQTVTDGAPKKEDAKLTTVETDLKIISAKIKKPLAGSTWVNVIKPPVNDDELNSIAIQTGSPQDDVENIDEIEKNDEFVIVRRYKTMETQTDVSFVTKIKEEEALIEKTFAVHHHTAAQTDEFSPEFLDESFESRDGTLDEAEEDEFYWKNVENIFTDDLLVQEQLAKISSKKGRSPLEILITVGKDGKKLFAPLRSDKSLEEAMDPRLEQFLTVLNETSVSNLFEDLLHQPLKTEISRGEKGGRLSGDIYLQPGKKESLPNQDTVEKPRRVDSKGAGSVPQKIDIKQSSSDIFGQTSTESLVTSHESISDCEEKERQDLEEVIRTGIQFLEASDLDEEPVKRHSTSSDELPVLPSSEEVCHSSLGSLRRFYTLKFLDSMDNTSNFSSVITVSEVNDNEIEFMSDSGMGQPRQGERTILKGGLQEQKKSVTVFREIQLKDVPPVYDTDKDFQQKAELKPMRKYISFRQKPRKPKPLLVKNWLVKNDQDEWIMVKQYHSFKKIHNYPDTYGSIDRISKDEEIDRHEDVTIGGNPIRGVLFSYFFPKTVFKYGISRTDRGNIEYLRRSDVAWSRIVQKNPERDPYHRNNALPLGFTKNYLKIEKHSSLLRSPEHSTSISSPRNESMDSSYEFVQMLKMEGEKVSPVVSQITKPDLPPPITVHEEEKETVIRKVDEEIVLKDRNYQKFKTDELQNILLELLIDNFVNYDIDIFEKTQPLQESDEELEGKSKTGENEECSRQKCKSSTETDLMRASLTSLTDDAINDLSFTESELHVICSQTLKSKRILEQADVKSYQSAEDIVLSKRDLKEFVNLLSGPKIVEHKDLNSFESDNIQFSLENVGCLNLIFSSVELVEGGKHIVRVANLNQNQVLKFVKSILREIYLHILSLSEKFNTATCVDGNSKDLLEVGSVHRIETLSSGMLFLNEIVNKISLQEIASKDDEDLESKNTYQILVSPKDLEIIREKFVERSLPLVKLLGRKDLCNKFPLVFTKSETSLLNMIYLNENIGKVSDNLIEEEVTYKDSLIDLIHSVQKSLSNKFSDSSVVDIRMALSRFENDWLMSRKCNDQNPDKCAISNWVEKLCSSKHYSQPDRESLKEVLRKITSSMDHLDKLEEYLESKKYAERRIIGQDLDEMESEVEIFEDDEKTRKAVKILKNILINRILSANDLLLPTGVEPVVSEVSFLGEDSESFVGSIDYSDSRSDEIREKTLGDASFDKIIVKRDTFVNWSECTGGEISSLVLPSKFPYLKAPQLPFMRKISDKTRILKFLSQECDYGALKRLKSVKQKKMSSVVEKCVGKVDFKLIHYRRSKFKRKLTLIRDRKMMYNTYFSYGIGSKPDKSLPILGKKLGDVSQGDDFCKDDGRLSNCGTCFETEQSSQTSLSNDLRHPLFPEDSLDSVEVVDDERYNEDECNAKLTRIREDIKNAKKYTPLKEKRAMPRINEVDTNDLSLNHMTNILNRRVRHLKNIVTGNWSESMTSLLGSSGLESGSNTSSKTLLNLPEITEPCTILFDNKTAKTSFSRKSSSSRASSETLKLPSITEPKPKEKSISTKKSFKEKRSSSSVKSVPLCVKLSEEFSEQNLESKQVAKRDRENYRLVASLKCDYRVKRDLMNLLEEPKKLPYLKPPPEYTPVPGFGDHPLLKFKLAESHVAQVHSFRMEKALKKAQFYKFSSEGETETNEEVQFMDPTKCITQPPWFPVSVVPRIMQKQVQSQCERYKETVEDCIREAKSIYDTIMFNKAVYDIIRVKDKPNFVHQVKLDVGGKTKNHAQFLERRKRIRDLLLIGHTLLKRTYDSLLENIPNTFVDFRRYREEKEYWNLQELTERMLDDLKKGCEHFCTVWYVRLDENFRKPEVLKEMTCDKIKRFMRLLSLILSYEISTAVERTLTNFTEVFCDKLKIPRLMFTTTLEATEFDKVDLHFCITPELKHIYKAVFKCMDCIFDIGQDLPMLFMPECKPIKRYHKTKIKFILTNTLDLAEIPVNLPVQQNHRLYAECHKALHESLEDNFKTLRTYMQTLEHSFAFLTYSQYATSTSSFLNNVKTTKEDVIDLLNIFKDYNDKIIRMLPFATFSMGLVEQEKTFKSLKVFVDDYIVSCIQTVSRFLKHDYYSLQSEFERVKKRALKLPITSEELVALGEFMSYVQTRWMRDRSTQIVTLSRYYWKILEYFAMPHHDYCQSLTDWYIWYLEMFPIFQQFATLYEQTKFEFDEKIRDTMGLIEDKRLELVDKIPLLNNLNDVSKISSYKQFVKRYLRDIEFITAKMDWVNNEEKIFNRTLTKFGMVEDLNNILLPFCKLIFKVYSWYQKQKTWFNNSFDLLVTEEVETTFDRYYKDLLEMSKDLKILCRSLEKDDLKYGVFTGYVDAEHEHQLPAPLILCHTTLHDLKEFQPILQLVTVICNKDLLERHWNEMSDIVGQDLTPNAGMTLLKYVDFDLFNVIDKLEIISSGASKELQLQDHLKKMYDEWKDLEFSVSKFKETDISILTGVDDIQALLDDQIVKTLAMRSSPFSKPVENDVRNWYDKLVRINRTIDVWGKVQVEWLHLYPIFTSEDIKQQMPKEAKFFQDVDTRFRNAIKLLMADRRAIVVGPAEGLLESLEACIHLMEEINNGVNLYLESKRLFFPRFFFLSNDEMLEILSQTTDPLRVQPHLKKCFEGIACLGFNEALDIYSMMSSEKEEITFIKKVSTKEARGSVEKWLVQVEKQMTRSVRHVISASVEACKRHERRVWVRAWPGQVVLCVSQAFWTAEVHRVLRKQTSRAVYLYHKKLNKQLSDIIQLVRGKLTAMARITLGALVVLDVHSKDVTYGLYVKGVINENDFEWMAQLRYYWARDMTVSITNATVAYAYEYLGNTARLVITPLTDRCYRTLVGAYHLHLNGAPEGPAGTGKTETTKDLAKALAVQCIVFNCSDGLDYIAMGKFFKGLASCGAWACFDEFNRIEVEVLSVVAQQILCIIQAVRKGLKQFVFEGTTLTLNPACYVCITMNPGYAGRSELPDNLKVLFRTVAMMVPDYGLIGEISLYSYGFINARKLSEKIVTTYRLCSEQLSSQSHYDYGMRAVKTVLQAAGNLKLKFPKQSEEVLLLRSIMDVNLPKFLNHDVPLFEGIISDLFPGVKLPTPNYDRFIGAITKSCEQHNLQPSAPFITKIIQTYEMMVVRHGFMLVGDPFSGKTSTLHVLADAITLLTGGKRPVKYQTLNPKSVTMGQLYGRFDDVSHEWSDGVLANAFREFAMSTSDERKWVIFDGPVDAVWIENMNTVLDDNKKLCLNSGEVITMTWSMSMIFEVMDLAQASPATVSRCGMIYMESSTLGWTVLVDSWLTSLPATLGAHAVTLAPICHWLIPACLAFCRRHATSQISAGVSNTVRSFCNFVTVFLTSAIMEHDVNQFNANALSWIQAAVILSAVWAFSGALDTDSRARFDVFFKDLVQGHDPDHEPPEAMSKLVSSVPPDGLWEDNFFTFKGRGFWSSWAEMAHSAKITPTDNLGQLVVPTLETVKYQYVIEKLVHNFLPVCLMGPTGTGKSFYIDDLITTRLSLQEFEPSSMTFTVNTQPNLVQTVVLSKLIKRKRSVFGPPIGKHCLVFIDDMNMPAKEIYGAQPPLELLRMYFDHGYWFDLKDMNKIFVEDLFFVAAMGPAGGSRQEVYARFLRHFCLLSINLFPEPSMTKIYSTLLVEAMRRKGFGVDFLSMFRATVTATINVYQKSILNLLPTPAKSHYTFNLRDISRVINGLMMFSKESFHDKPDFISLWLHEMLRVFSDRLVESNDRKWFFTQLKESVKSNFRSTMEETLKDMKREGSEVTEEDMTNLMFTSIFDLDNPDDRLYEQVVDMEPFTRIIQDNLDTYNHMHKSKIDIVLFRYALVHLSRILRLLSMPGGNGLLVGVAGSGRQSLTKLAAAVFRLAVFQPEIKELYEFNEWRDDLKLVMKECGGRGHPMVFLFTENQIKHEYFLQDIDVLLNTGEVPSIFSLEETQEVLEMARLGAQGGNRNLDVHPLSVLSYFRSQCKRNIHLMICFSPIGNTFRNRIRLYPAFVNCCTIDWFEDWPEDALEKVAERCFHNDKFDENMRSSLVNACKYFHVTTRHQAEEFFLNTGRKTYITSGSYLNLIRLYTNLFEVKQKEVMEAKMRYVTGLDSLQFAADQIAVMKSELEALQPQLRGAAAAAAAMAAEIGAERVQVEAARQLVAADEVRAEADAGRANLLKQECQVELAATIPILNEAVAALNTLKPNDITVVKAMKNPPKAVKLVMAAVCIMMGIKAAKVPDPNNPGRFKMDFWIPSVRLLGNINFLKNLKEYDKDNISPAIIALIRKDYIPNKEFNPAVVKKASKAAEGLCKWVIAMEQYDEVIKIVAPKKERMEKAEEEYERTMQELNDKKALLSGFEEKLSLLEERLKQTVALKAQLTEEANMCWEKLQRAQQLIGGLGGEKERWTQAANSLQRSYDNLAGDVLLSSAFIAYLGPFTSAYRHPLINNWKHETGKLSIPCSSDFDFIRLVGKDYVIQQWHLDGLPKDKFSVENGVMMASTNRYTFLIDPEGQANRWLKTMYMDANMEVLKISDKQLMKKVETGILYGQPVLLEDVGEELDACLDPILLRTTFRQGGRDYITIGTKVIELHKDFNLFITTRLRCPHFLPEVLNKVTVINFALTKEALDDQLLAIAITILSPELEARRASMIVQSALNATALRNAEEDILKALSAPDKNVLEDENTVIILNESQKIAADIKEREKGTIETSDRISEFNKSFAQPVIYARSLYYCLTDLPNIDPMYHFSLPWFLRIYSGSLKADYDHFVEISNQSESVRKNARFMPNMTFSLYSNVCRSLFEKDKLLFSFILCTNLMLTESKIKMEDLSFLLTGGVVLVNLIPNPAPDWIMVRSWDELCRLSLLDGYQGLKENVENNLADWRLYYDKAEPHNEALPEPWDSNLTPFQKLLVLRIFHLDKMVPAIRNFVEHEMDESFVTPPLFDIAESYKDSNKVTPMVFILSPGVDPMAALQQFAEKMGYKEHEFESVSLGQGQGPIAENLIKKARLGGTWVCLQNCHLATSWMPTLEAICDDLIFSTKDGFRLWLTSYPSDKFPVPILQNGVKMTNEPPTGLKQNMLRTFMSEPITDQDFYGSCSADSAKQFVFARLLFGLTFFHAVVLERKKYGPIGWNIPYGFNESDYNISVLQLQQYMLESEEVPFEAVTYLTGECNYGGRVTDNWDRRTLNTMLASFVNAHIAANQDYCMLDNFSELTVNANRHEFDYYIGIIENISDVQPAEVVGLHSNASISRDLHCSRELLEAMQLVQPKVRGGEGGKRDDHMVEAITTDILQKLPRAFDLDLALERYPVTYSESMNTVLVQEMERFNRLTRVMRASIVMLQRAILGEAVMTPDLETTFGAVLANRLPSAWARVSYPSLKPLAEYVADLIARLRFLQDWYDKGIPSCFWISGFFFTQAFLTAAMQNYARAHVIPIDLLTFDFVVTSHAANSDVTNPPKDGVYVHGLFLEGARWDRQLGQLEEQLPKMLFDMMPVIHFVPKLKKDSREDGRYACPLYKTSERRGILSTTGHSTNYVLPLLLACSRSPAHWVKRALLLEVLLVVDIYATASTYHYGKPLQALWATKLDHLQVLDSLLTTTGYDRRATPTNHLNQPTNVFCELYIRSFGSISPATMDYEVDLYLRQKWQDERLKHADITEVLDLNDPNLVKAIWKPEVYFPNAKHAEFQFVTVPNVLIRINPDGEILYMLRLKLTFSCMMDLSKFPLDSQICTMEVSSFSKTTEELRLEWKSLNPVIMGKGLRMPQFEIVNIKAAECQESFQIGNYSCLVAEFYLSRSVGFHLVQSYLPTILIVVISWVSFWMDVDSVPGRTTLGVTTLLAVSSQSSGIQSGLPQVSYVKAIDVWMGTCTAFVFCALLEFTFVNYMWRKIAPDFTHNNVQPTDSRTNGKDMLSNAIALNLVRKSTVLQGQLTKNMKTARKIDEYSRLLFPLAFAMFNILYWTYYLR